MTTLVVIPARMASSRFPGKPLVKIAGREMILRVCDQLPSFEKIVATPDQEIYDRVVNAGYSAFLTQTDCKTGTDRLVEVAEKIPADIYINVQGDEPLILQNDIFAIDKAKKEENTYIIGTVSRMYNNPNDVKCILQKGKLVGISRIVCRQRGLYALNGEDLRLFGLAEKTESESIEMTRFIQIGYPIKMVEITDTPDVNTPDDIKKIEERLICQQKLFQQ